MRIIHGWECDPARRENFFNAPAASNALGLSISSSAVITISVSSRRGPPRPREKHNRFLVGNSRQGLHYAARRFLEQISLQMPQRLNAAHSSEGAGGCDDDFVVRIINH